MKVINVDGVFQFSSSSSRSSRRCLLRHSRPFWFLIVAYFVLCCPIVVKSRLCLDDVHVTRQSYLASSVYGRQSFGDYYGPGDVCPCSSSFCFLSTLAGFLAEEDAIEVAKGYGQTSRSATFKMTNGEIVSCSLRNSGNGIPLLQGFGNRSVTVDRVDFCEGSLFPDLWMKASSAPSSDLDEHLEEVESGILISSSSLPEIEISPPILDWGTKNMYSPSLEILEVINKHNESVLNVYDLFSTNTQFNAYSFQTLSLSPGESASIPLIFLPKWLGLSSAQLVLQTSFGGFVIHAKGVATMSPYQLQPLVGLNISTGRRLSRKLSLYNPYNDVLHVKEVATWISISGSKKTNSALVLCSTNRFQQHDIQSASNTDSEWLSLRSGELGSSRLDIRPHQHWEVPPNSSRSILELNLWPHLGREVSGAICLNLGNSSQEISETIILPIDIEMNERGSYTDLTGSVSLYFDTLVPCHGRKTVFSISLRNDASYLLHVVKISEETKACNIFEIRYMEGLLLFPGTVTQIALVTYSHPLNSHDRVAENHSSGLNCLLSISTNDSVNPEISIPCHDLVLNSCKYQKGFHTFESEGSYIKLISKREDEKCASTITESLGNASEESSQFKPKASEEIKADDLLLNNWKSQATMTRMSVLEDQELLFPVVQIGNHHSKWISVHNPSKKPVVMQLVLNSGTIIDHCKSTDEHSEHTFLTTFSHFTSAEIGVGFSIAETAVTEAFVHPLGSALFGPVIFHPSNRCMWRSSALIRNNLSGVEWLPLQAFGGSHSIVILEGSVPILKLDFDLHSLMTFNVSASDTLVPVEKITSFCSNLFSKELFVKNIGELPLQIIKLKVSGTDCGSDGFTIHNCKGFSLAPGESTNLLISYQADFSTSVIRRDFELAMDTGILVIPMKARVPGYMINMCRKPLFRSIHWKLFLVVLFASFIILHFMFRIIPQAFSPSNDDYFFKFSNTVGSPSKTEASSPPQQNTRISRSSRDDEKYVATNYFNGYLDCTTDHRDTARKKMVIDCLDHQKNGSFSPPLGNSHIEVAKTAQTLEMPQNCNLTVRVVREKVRRRKRRPNGAGLPQKLDFSSSQSGNSTPSSPLSPNISTPKHILSQSPETIVVPLCPQESKEHNNSKRPGFEVSNLAGKAESVKCSDSKWSSSPDQGLPSATTKFPGKPSLLSCAIFPGPGLRTPVVADSSFMASMSPIAPCARAPGTKLCKEKTIKGEVSDAMQEDFTYDIWGNHFSERIFYRPEESTSKLSDASEGDSYSFFTRDPQSPMMMSLPRSVSPGFEFSS
ncbi:hypothetical protein KFK09_025414 [Dendrobium nobile]|uniref:Transmembrane protein 131-like N-terminal domain-containing protein n=1 Tax=Dendrobium nobile TaxID=94219 RepID=A0A8T3AGS5_DENNO|nr:hypothetical protein KFK09_025414 [Dendrobium nobile]